MSNSELKQLLSGIADVICRKARPPAYNYNGAAVSALIHTLQELLEIANDDILERINCADFDDYEYLEVLLQHFDMKLRQEPTEMKK